MDELIEELSALEHEQWMAWTKSVARKLEHLKDKVLVEDMDVTSAVVIIQEILDRWKKNWKFYSELSNDEKEKDREYARKIMDVLDGVNYHG